MCLDDKNVIFANVKAFFLKRDSRKITLLSERTVPYLQDTWVHLKAEIFQLTMIICEMG